MKDLKAKLALQSLGQLNAAQEEAGVLTSADKATALQAVHDLLLNGALDLDQVQHPGICSQTRRGGCCR